MNLDKRHTVSKDSTAVLFLDLSLDRLRVCLKYNVKIDKIEIPMSKIALLIII